MSDKPKDTTYIFVHRRKLDGTTYAYSCIHCGASWKIYQKSICYCGRANDWPCEYVYGKPGEFSSKGFKAIKHPKRFAQRRALKQAPHTLAL